MNKEKRIDKYIDFMPVSLSVFSRIVGRFNI